MPVPYRDGASTQCRKLLTIAWSYIALASWIGAGQRVYYPAPSRDLRTTTWMYPAPSMLLLAAASLAPLGTPSLPPLEVGLEQMAYDAGTDTFYIASYATCVIYALGNASTALIDPLSGTPWPLTIAAGVEGTCGVPTASEVTFSTPTFYGLAGLVGCPLSSVVGVRGRSMPTRRNDAIWVGLWVTMYDYHAVRFINFLRNNNITLVAGSDQASYGNQDGIGLSARLYTPCYATQGRVGGEGVVLWSEERNSCVRQGVPVSGLTNQPFNGTSVGLLPPLQQMVLRVSAFIGLCGGAQGQGTGLAYLQEATLKWPFGVALLAATWGDDHAPRDDSMRNSTALFVGEGSGRLSMVSPLWPPAARYLTPIWSSSAIRGIIAIIRLGTPLTSQVKIFCSCDRLPYANVSMTVQFDNSSNHELLGTKVLSIVTDSIQIDTSWIASNVVGSYHVLFLPHRSPSQFEQHASTTSFNETMIVVSGSKVGYSSSASLQFYCCIDGEYARWLTGANQVRVSRTPSPTLTTTVRGSASKPPARSPSRTLSFSDRWSDSKTVTISRMPPVSTVTNHHMRYSLESATRTVATMVIVDRSSSTMRRNHTIDGRYLPPTTP